MALWRSGSLLNKLFTINGFIYKRVFLMLYFPTKTLSFNSKLINMITKYYHKYQIRFAKMIKKFLNMENTFFSSSIVLMNMFVISYKKVVELV